MSENDMAALGAVYFIVFVVAALALLIKFGGRYGRWLNRRRIERQIMHGYNEQRVVDDIAKDMRRRGMFND